MREVLFMIQITPSISINENELQFEYVRASGPGGQKVNKVATAAQLRFDVWTSSLPENVKARLLAIAGKRVNAEGVLLIEAKRFRTQEQNREDAIKRFIELVHKASIKPKKRKKTQPTQASKERRMQEKKQRGKIKKSRQSKSFED